MENYEFLKRSLTKKLKTIRSGDYKKLPPKYQGIYQSVLNSSHKDEILKVGTALLIYLLDVIRKDPVDGAKLISYLTLGYPDKKNTDLTFPIYECTNLQRLYIKATKDYGFTNSKTQGLIINAYFRWYCSVYETYRKVLIYCIYCNKIQGKQEFSNIDNYLFGITSPYKCLDSESKNNSREILKYFNGGIRHSISHANIYLLQGEKGSDLLSILLRETSAEKNGVNEKYFKDITVFANETEKDITIMNQSMRLFFGVVGSYVIDCYGDAYTEIVGKQLLVSPYQARIINEGVLY